MKIEFDSISKTSASHVTLKLWVMSDRATPVIL